MIFGNCHLITNLENAVFQTYSLCLEVANTLGQAYYYVFQPKSILPHLFLVAHFLSIDFYFH